MVSTNFKVSAEAKKAFNDNISSKKYRYLILKIENEEIQFEKAVERSDSLEDDFNSIKKNINDPAKDSMYVLFNMEGDKYLLMIYLGKKSKVQQKMLHSSSVGVLKSQLGQSYFLGDHSFDDDELVYKNLTWQSHEERYNNRSHMMNDDELHEVHESSNLAPTTSGVRGVSFPVSDDVNNALTAFKDGNKGAVVVKIEKETVELDFALDKGDVDGVAAKLPEKEPRFIFLNWAHQHEGKDCSANFFIYVCPQGSKVKQRMVYSSAKSNVILLHKISFDHKLEVSDSSELTSSNLMDEAHPVKEEVQVFKTKKPKRASRGRRRVLLN